MPRLFVNLATLRELLRLSLPMVVSQGAFAVMVFTDRYFMSQIDAAHIAAALGGGVAAFFTTALFSGTIAYANALVAQNFGAGDYAKCARVVSQGFILSLACVPLILLASFYVGDIFAAMQHDPQQVALEREYYFILIWVSILTLFKTCLACFFAGTGKTRVVMICDVTGVLVNIPLTYILVYGKLGFPAMGIAGAAYGTVAATIISIALFIMFYQTQKIRDKYQLRQSLRLDIPVLRRYLRLGAPSGLETFLNFGTFNLFLLMFQSYGIAQGAAMAIVFNWDMLSFVPLMGMNIGVMSLIGRFVGAGDMTRTNQVISSGFMVAWAYSGLLGLCFIIFREPLMMVFATPDDDFSEILALGSQMMLGLATYVMADATILIAGGALRGAGDTRWLMFTSVSLHCLMVIAQYFIIMVFDLGPLVSWWVFVSFLLLLAVAYVARLAGGVWRRPERLAMVMVE